MREGGKEGLRGSESVGKGAATNGEGRPLFRKARRLWNDTTQVVCAPKRITVGRVSGMRPRGYEKKSCGEERRASSTSTYQ